MDMNDILKSIGQKQPQEKKKSAPRIQMIHYTKLKPSPDNFYDTEGIEKLAAAIRIAGEVKNPLRVRKTDIDEYEVNEGHRRRLATIYNVEQLGIKELEFVPCVVEDTTSTIGKLNLILSNSTQRERTSLKILKDLVNENEIKAVLGYLDQKMPVDSLPVVSQPVVSVQDTVFVSNPGNYFSENDCQNLKENYGRLFRSISAFYENYKTYRLYMQDQSYKKDNNALADKIRKEELLLSIALSEYKQVIFDILTPIVEGAKITLTPIKGNVKDK